MKYLYLAITIFLFASCEDVIDLPLEEGPKRLVIDANINWEKGTTGAEQSIRLTQTAGFYDLTVPIATGAKVKITNSNNDEFDFIEEGTTGIYSTSTFMPVIDETYTLTVTYNGEEFTAEETLLALPSIDRIEQTTDNFFGTEVIKVEFFYLDPAGIDNYYFSQFSYPTDYAIDVYRTRDDEFSDGQENSFFEQDDSLKPGKDLTIYFYSASKTNFNYMNLLLDQVSSGGPFAAPPAAVQGNCINTTDAEKKPYGYFRLSQMEKTVYTITNENSITLPPF
ncbi:DUF4249 domain-containing protein [Flavicella sp.]|uniref:DUF4249 domain-containing protein n=1 Tax=Flavicella sp. TaxID=2957742 RepID=UPI002625A776|nr:DUF4249 domain-containing protein [Flavicella sp.]MDG1805730.1 DUF4249 domain-containing protein [Flavicella sp.]